MPFHKDHIQFLNDTIKAGLTDPRFIGAEYFGIAEQVPEKEGQNTTLKPKAIVGTEYKPVKIPGDKLFIYHRLLDEMDYFDGDKMGGSRTVSNYKMVVYAPEKLKLTSYELATLIRRYFPTELSPALKAATKTTTGFTKGQTDFKKFQLWNSEFVNVPFPLKSEDLFFSITYSTESTYKNGCFDLCNCTSLADES